MTTEIFNEPVLIIGCGRSGTRYTAKLLQAMKKDVGHEILGKYGLACWWVTPPNWHDYPRPSTFWGDKKDLTPEDIAHLNIVHQVRNPVDVIASCQTFVTATWEYIANFIKIDMGRSEIYRGMQYWIEWNKLAEMETDCKIRVEDLTEAGEKHKIPADVNTRKHRYDPITYHNLIQEDNSLAAAIRALANDYGYGDEYFV